MPVENQYRPVVEVSPSELDAMTQQSMVQGGGIVTAIISLVGALMWLRRRYSRDGLEVQKDKSEGHLLSIIIKERNAAMDEAREAWAKRASDAELIGKLSAQVEALNDLNRQTNQEVQLLRVLNKKQTQEIENLRDEFNKMREQLKSCATCPLRSSQK